ncbi:hypothetical protein Sulac_0572 [Sulfobacillus acidophilus DSM 10332]|uniref:Uncharacterized protein n=1 Tax=Sulfobacillus acidophilus (strain ATCC 700253 / DSM 10332 / NAL) TaxID=679936 RepID=G8TZD4_SULAD|nr:hypothetical protein Sulac_0572 [Sulfobacillus acidophilus DSM 10332]
MRPETIHGALPWTTVVIPDQSSLQLSWRPPYPPNMVHVLALNQRLTANQMIQPRNILVACAVNVTYPQNHGCTLSGAGTLTIDWSPHVLNHVKGLVIAALWIPNHPVTSPNLTSHQVTWIVGIGR